jgi:MFS family permease
MTSSTTPAGTALSAPPGSRRAWSVVALLMGLMAVNFLDKAVMGLAAQPMIDDLGLTLDQYGLASSAFFLLFFVASAAAGFVADRVGVRWILLVLAGLWAVAQLSMVFAGGLTLLLLSRLLLGASEGPTFPLVNHAAYGWLPEKDRSLASSLLTGGASVGVLAGTPLLTWLITDHGWRAAYLVTALVTLVWCVVWLLLGREGPLTVHAPAPLSRGPERVSLLRGLRSPTFLATAFVGFAAYWWIALSLSFGPLYVQQILGLSLAETGRFVVVREAVSVLVVYVGIGLLTRRLLRRGISTTRVRGGLSALGMLVGGISTVGFVLLPGTGTKLALGIVGVAAVIGLTMAPAVCGELVPVGQRGSLLGVFGALYALAGVIAPLVAGRLASVQGPARGLPAAWLMLACLLIAAGVVAALFVRPGRDAERIAAHARPGT